MAQMVMMTSACCTAVLVLVLCGVAQAFMPVSGGTNTHATITGNAVLSKITEVCRAVAESEGREFNPTGSSAEELLRACLGTATGEVSAAKFRTALNQIYMQNGLVDRDLANSPAHHFSNEAFAQARALITEGTVSVKANVRKGNFQAARETLGRACHTLQDFYSHSNWVELGNRGPYMNLLRPDLPIDNVAGKCSHGGASDMTSTEIPRGGISKDERRADNAALHDAAVAVATQATLALLEDIRGAAGNKEFLRLMGIARSSVLCFVIDTTGSMADDIAEAKRVASNIIDSKKGTVDEPSEYILVQFNDPKFGPLVRTTDPDVMKNQIAALSANGGGDIPEMCLSGLELALTGAPPSSQIYIFTDAPAKDMHLEKTIIALIRSSKSTVNIFMTPSKRSSKYSGRYPRADFRVYYDMALASGGQAVEVSKSSLPEATEIIVDSSTSALVTILQRARNPGKIETFPFLLDESVSNVTLYITGTAVAFTLQNPTGVSQSSTETTGPLGTINTVGNLKRVRLTTLNQTGLWEIRMNSGNAYTVKVTGSPTKLLLTLTGRHGPESLKVMEAALVEVSGSGVANGTVEDMGGGNFLVSINSAPAGEFVVLLKGKDASTSSRFQRQSTTQMSVTPVSVKVVADSSMEPGKSLDIPFTISTSVPRTKFNIRARNDKNFVMKYPNSIVSGSRSTADGTLTITAPSNTASGTDITLTIDVESAGTSDSNYAVVRLSVIKKVTDFTPPECNMFNINNSCPTDCRNASWHATVNMTDGNGTGVEKVWIQEGDVFHSANETEHGGITVIQYFCQISCCTPNLKVSVTDKEGNVGTCFHSIRPITTPAPFTTPNGGPPSLGMATPLWICLLLSATAMIRDLAPLSL
ncbi:von Willebrand factor A domain-containing protein 7 [Sardina pilchardus]|uniref:von Willebrand factor A domain-containing protein 7 n=1 Tax=Sardina pilchardus TaxID=27697 RepID=UPI002E10C97D